MSSLESLNNCTFLLLLQVRKLFTWQQLLYCINSNHWDYSVRAAYFDLFNTLHLEHEVNSRLMVRNDHIFAIETYQGLDVSRRSSLSHSIVDNEIAVNAIAHRFTHYFPVDELKTVFFNFLEKLMVNEIFTCRMLSRSDHTNILRPLLVALDSLVVLQVINEKEEMDKLLSLLHPSFSEKKGLYERKNTQ